MKQTNQNFDLQSTIRTAQINPLHPLESLTPMGRKLLEMAEKIASSDELPFSEEDIENELTTRRGGYINSRLGKNLFRL